MNGKTVLITGSSRGIGLGLVKEYLGRGCHIIATCRTPDKATELNETLKSASQLPPFVCDVASDESIANCLIEIRGKVSKIDVLINNAGISTPDHPCELPSEVKRQEFLNVLNTNVAGVIAMSQAFIPLLADDGKVINISSCLGSIQLVDNLNCTSYRISKAGVNMLTKSFSLEFPKLTFVAVHPGWVQTDMGSTKNRSPPVKVEDSARGIADVTANVSLQKSGSFWSFDGQELSY